MEFPYTLYTEFIKYEQINLWAFCEFRNIKKHLSTNECRNCWMDQLYFKYFYIY